MSKTVTRPLKAFLCHASGDKPAIREMYKRLVFEGVDAWLDKEKLLPGQDWRVEIPKAVQEADVVIVFLSKKSVSKEGYVQKEIKFALDIAEEKPEGTIFLIPARLEDCLVPERLSRWQWVDLFEDNGFVQLLRSLKLRARAVGATVEQASYQESDSEVVRRVEQLYTEGLAAFYTEEWDRACRRFQAILSEYPNHKNAAEKLAEAETQRNLTQLYALAKQEYQAENWQVAIQSLEELLQRMPEYKDASQLLRNAKKQKRLRELYAEAKSLHAAQKWQAVIKVFEQISAIEPTCPDPDGLLPSAQKEVAELKRIADLNDQYSFAVRRMDAGEWLEARTLLEKVHKSQTGFLETERLLRKAEDEIMKVEEQNRRRDQVNLLYEQAHGLVRSKNWRKALDKIEEIQQLDSHFEDKDGITEQAKAELAREEQEIQRQNELAAMYAESVRLMQEGKYQEALDKWEKVRALDPKYPDRQGVQRTARKKLLEITKSVKVKPRFKMKKSIWMGMAAFVLVVAIITGVILLVQGSGKIWSAPTPGNTSATSPATSVPYKSSTPHPATSVPETSGYTDPMMYDDFDNAQYDGIYNQAKWSFWRSTGSGGQFVQKKGELAINMGVNDSVDINLAKYQSHLISKPTFIEAKIMLDPAKSTTNLSMGFEAFSGNTFFGHSVCSISNNKKSETQNLSCGNNYHDNYQEVVSNKNLNASWHLIRIEIDPSKTKVDYYVDGLRTETYVSSDTNELKKARFRFVLGMARDNSDTSSPVGYIDYVRMGAIEDDPASQEPFSRAVGEWETVDWTDKSHMTMTIKRASAGQYIFALVDSSAGFCGGGFGKADFKADTFSNTATGTFEFVCDSSGHSGNFEYKFTYNSVNDQFVDDAGVIWTRKK